MSSAVAGEQVLAGGSGGVKCVGLRFNVGLTRRTF